MMVQRVKRAERHQRQREREYAALMYVYDSIRRRAAERPAGPDDYIFHHGGYESPPSSDPVATDKGKGRP
jgi:hypothetical protein